MKPIEMEGKTVEEAIHKALSELKAKRSDVDINIISEGKSGLFGLMGSTPARVRIVLKTSLKSIEKSEISQLSDEQIQAVRNKTVQILSDIFKYMNIQAETTVAYDNGRIEAEFKTSDASLLIGNKGQTLNAIELLLNVLVNRGAEPRVKIVVDTEGYRGRRQEALERLAIKLADKVIKTGKKCEMESMNAHERRIIHMTLQNNPAIESIAEGEGIYRRVVIYPKDKP